MFGFVYGSVFGNEHLLGGFKVLEGDGVVTDTHRHRRRRRSAHTYNRRH